MDKYKVFSLKKRRLFVRMGEWLCRLTMFARQSYRLEICSGIVSALTTANRRFF